MDPKSLPPLKRISQYTANLALGGVIRLAMSLPYRWRIPAVGWFVSRVVAPLAGWRKRIRKNLAHAWPELPEAEVERIAREVPDNAGRTLIETYSGAELKKRLASVTPEGPGWKVIEDARAAGRSVFIISGHFGNYDAVRSFVAMKFGDVGGLYRPLNNVYFNRHYEKALSQPSTPLFERGRRGLAQMMKFVREGNVMAMLTDQHFDHGAPLTFFGKRAYTALSVPEIALKYDVPIVPCYGIRQPDGLSFRLVFEDPIPHSTPEEMGQALNDSLEARVRDHPELWFWIHRRWKDRAHQPDPADETA
jgi:KDO2-lipid IV(A) lauroyltransferase